MNARDAFEHYLRSGYEITHPGQSTYKPELEEYYVYCRDHRGECDDILRKACSSGRGISSTTQSRSLAQNSPYISRFCGCFVEGIAGIPRACDPLCRGAIKPADLDQCNPDLCIISRVNPGDNVYALCSECKTGKCSPVFVADNYESLRVMMDNLANPEIIPDVFPTYSCMQAGKLVRCPIRSKKSKWTWILLISAGVVILVIAILLLINNTNPLVVLIISLIFLSPFLIWYLLS